MNWVKLAVWNIAGSAFRSWVVFMCAFLLAGFALWTTLITQGAEASLHSAIERLGADVVVLPEGSQMKVETALLMGKPASVWMPEDTASRVTNIPGVLQVSPQLYLASLANASCCAASEMFVVAYDPKTDFTIRPWAEKNLGKELGLGEAVGGSRVFTPAGEEHIKLYGYGITLKGNLEPTGTGLDQTMFLTFDTAREVAHRSFTRAEKPLDIPPQKISALMVKTAPGVDPTGVALEIIQDVPGVLAIPSPDLFQSFRKQMTGLLRGISAVLLVAWLLSIVMIGLVFSMAVNERRREMGVLRALGASRQSVFRILLTEAGILALGGGSGGVLLAAWSTYLFRNLLILTLGVPFMLPSLTSLLTMVGGGLVIALLSVTLAALLPALRISRQEPAVAMRE